MMASASLLPRTAASIRKQPIAPPREGLQENLLHENIFEISLVMVL